MAINMYLKIYSNDGSTLLFTSQAYTQSNDTGTITSTGFEFTVNGEADKETYTYSGGLKFLGFSTQANAQEPFYAIGETIDSLGGGVNTLYIVESLEGSTWYVPSGWEVVAGYGDFQVDSTEITSNNVTTKINSVINFGASIDDDLDYVATSNSIGFWNTDGAFTLIDNTQSITFKFSDTGGDLTSPDLISWLETYGTQLKVTDLTNTIWNVEAGWEAEAGYGRFFVYGYSEDLSPLYPTIYSFNVGYENDSKAEHTISGYYGDGELFVADPSQIFSVTFEGGTDTTNPKLIAWLSKWGELEQEEEPEAPSYSFIMLNVNNPSETATYDYSVSETSWSTIPDLHSEFTQPSGEEQIFYKGFGVYEDETLASEVWFDMGVVNGKTYYYAGEREEEKMQTLTVINVNNESETATYEVSADTTFEDICISTSDWQVKFSDLGSEYNVFYAPTATSAFVDGYQLYSDSECTVAVNYSNSAIGTFYYKGEGQPEDTPSYELSGVRVLKQDAPPINPDSVMGVGGMWKEQAFNEYGCEIEPIEFNQAQLIGVTPVVCFGDIYDADNVPHVFNNGVVVKQVLDGETIYEYVDLSENSTIIYAPFKLISIPTEEVRDWFIENTIEVNLAATFDLSTLNLGEREHVIVVRAKTSGYETSAESNVVIYVVEETSEEPTITDLKGYRVSVQDGWTLGSMQEMFEIQGIYTYGGMIDTLTNLALGMTGGGFPSTTDITFWNNGDTYTINSGAFTIEVTGGADTLRENLIQWFVDNDATFEKTSDEEPDTEMQTLTVINSNNEL